MFRLWLNTKWRSLQTTLLMWVKRTQEKAYINIRTLTFSKFCSMLPHKMRQRENTAATCYKLKNAQNRRTMCIKSAVYNGERLIFYSHRRNEMEWQQNIKPAWQTHSDNRTEKMMNARKNRYCEIPLGCLFCLFDLIAKKTTTTK